MKNSTSSKRERFLVLEHLESRAMLAAIEPGIVDTPQDIPQCTLRAAIEEANATAGHQKIESVSYTHLTLPTTPYV